MAELDAVSQEQLKTMERFYKNAAKVVPEFPLLINVPRKKLVARLLLYWIWLFFTALFSFGLLWMVTIISFVYLCQKLYLFSMLWNAYKYSRIILWVPSILIACTAFSDSTRHFLFDLFKYIFS